MEKTRTFLGGLALASFALLCRADGYLRASVSPEKYEEIARWRVDDGAWQRFGGAPPLLSDGRHVVSCLSFPAPQDQAKICKAPDQEILIVNGATTQVLCAYVCA